LLLAQLVTHVEQHSQQQEVQAIQKQSDCFHQLKAAFQVLLQTILAGIIR